MRGLAADCRRLSADGCGMPGYLRDVDPAYGLEPGAGRRVAPVGFFKMTPVAVEGIAEETSTAVLDGCSGRDISG